MKHVVVAVLSGLFTGSVHAQQARLLSPPCPEMPCGFVDLSADGSRVAVSVWSGPRQYVWSEDAGFIALPPHMGSHPSAVCISADGAIVGGQVVAGSPEGFNGAIWEVGGAFRLLPDSGVGAGDASVADLSATGRVIVGQAAPGSIPAQPAIWTDASGWVALPTIAGSSSPMGAAYGVSANGRIVAGSMFLPGSGYVALRWVDGAGPFSLTHAGTVVLGSARHVSADGTTIVGSGQAGPLSGAFRWTAGDGAEFLPGLPGLPATGSEAFGVSADGQYVVGTVFDAVGRTAVVWDGDSAPRTLAEIFASGGVDLTLWQRFDAVNAISDDGRVIVGEGILLGGTRSPFIAILDRQPVRPCADASGDGRIDFVDITSVLANWASPGPFGDANHDGVVDFADITTVLANFGSKCQ